MPFPAGEPAGTELDLVEPAGHVVDQRGTVDLGVGGEHRRRVYQVADPLLRGGPGASAVPFQQPTQAAPLHTLHGGRCDRDRLVLVVQRPVVGQRRQTPPVGRVGPGYPRLGQPGQVRGRDRPPVGRRTGVGQGAPQLGHQGRQSERPGQPRRDRVLLRILSGQLGQEPGRLLLPVAGGDRGDDHPLPGPGHRDGEQPALLVQQRGGLPDRAQLPPGQDVDQLLGAQDAAAQPEIGPDPFLYAGHQDDLPLQPLGGVGGQDAYRRAPVGRLRDGVGGQLLPGQLIHEDLGTRPRQPVGEARRRVEQHHDRVEVPVGGGPPVAAPGADRRPPFGQPAGLPQGPERVLGGGAGPRRLPYRAQEPRHGLGRRRPAPFDREQVPGIVEGLDQQDARGPPVAGRQGQRAQTLAQPALGHRVGPAERGVQQRDRRLLVQPFRLQRAAQRQQQRGDRRLDRDRQVLGGRGHRYRGLLQRPGQWGEQEVRGAHHDRHPRPRHPVDQVGLAEPVRHVRRLAGRRPEGVRLRAAGRGVGIRGEQPVAYRATQPGRDAGGGGEQLGTGAVTGRQVQGPGGEAVREVVHAGRVGALERVRRGVRVGEPDQVRAVAGDQLQQVELGRVGVGQLVDVDPGEVPALGGQQVGLVAEQADRRAYQLGAVVRDAGPAGHVTQGEDLHVLA